MQGKRRPSRPINLSLTISVLTPLTSGLPSGGPCRSSRGPVLRGGAHRPLRGRGGRSCRAVADHETSPAWFARASLFRAWLLRRCWRRPCSRQRQVKRSRLRSPSVIYDDLLLQPSLPGNPANPPSFAPPGNRGNTSSQSGAAGGDIHAPPSRIGATPVYGSPTGFGAGDTGFNSSNAPRKRVAQVPGLGSALAPTGRDHLPARAARAAASLVSAADAAAAAGACSLSRQSCGAARRGVAAAAH